MDNHELTGKMIFADQMHRRVSGRQVEKYGLHRGEHRLLMCLSEHKEVSQRDLAERLQVSAATVTISVKVLEKKGLIVRTAKSGDNRFKLLHVTDKGRDIVAKSKKAFDKVNECCFQGFSSEEKEVLADFFERMYQNLSEYK